MKAKKTLIRYRNGEGFRNSMTPDEDGEWVRYADIPFQDGVAYETVDHSTVSHSPRTGGTLVLGLSTHSSYPPVPVLYRLEGSSLKEVGMVEFSEIEAACGGRECEPLLVLLRAQSDEAIQLRDLGGWIPASEPPKTVKNVLVLHSGGTICMGNYRRDIGELSDPGKYKGWWSERLAWARSQPREFEEPDPGPVTHWQPLPAPPSPEGSREEDPT